MPRELTREQLSVLCIVGASPRDLPEMIRRGFAKRIDAYGRWRHELTPAGQALVDIALRAVNAQLRSEHD
jgi:hypothetical protein